MHNIINRNILKCDKWFIIFGVNNFNADFRWFFPWTVCLTFPWTFQKKKKIINKNSTFMSNSKKLFLCTVSRSSLVWKRKRLHSNNKSILSLNHVSYSPQFRYICFFMNKSAFVNKLYTVFLHIIPALLIDFIILCIGKKPR